MPTLPDEFRAKAKEQVAASAAMFEAEDFDASAKKQALAVIGQVNATVYSALADAMDYVRLSVGSESSLARTAAFLRRNHAIRKAAARGDWNEFDRLVADGGNTDTTDGGGSQKPS